MGKKNKNRKLGKRGNIKREKEESQLSKESTFKSFLILNWISNFIIGKDLKTCKGIWGHLGVILGVTLGGWGK